VPPAVCKGWARRNRAVRPSRLGDAESDRLVAHLVRRAAPTGRVEPLPSHEKYGRHQCGGWHRPHQNEVRPNGHDGDAGGIVNEGAGYRSAMTTNDAPSEPVTRSDADGATASADGATTRQTESNPLKDVLEAFNAEDVVERPGQPPREPASPTDDSDAQAPG